MNYSCKRPPLPFQQGERIKVRGSPAARISKVNPHPTLSLAKGEAKESTGGCASAT